MNSLHKWQQTSAARFMRQHKWFFDIPIGAYAPPFAIWCWILLLFPMLLLPKSFFPVDFYVWAVLLFVFWILIRVALTGENKNAK